MIKFRNFFSFSQAEIASTFPRITVIKRLPGLRLMQAPLQINLPTTRDLPSYGKLLIVISRKTGKAHLRNLFRRRIKSIFYENKLYEKKLYSVLNVYPEAVKLSFEQLQEKVVFLFKDEKGN